MSLKPTTRTVLALLRIYPEGVTPLVALEHGAGFRLGARVWELRQAGYDVQTEWETTIGGARIARYVLREQLTLGIA